MIGNQQITSDKKPVFLVFENEKQKAQWTCRLKEAIISSIKKSRAMEAMVVPDAEHVGWQFYFLKLLKTLFTMEIQKTYLQPARKIRSNSVFTALPNKTKRAASKPFVSSTYEEWVPENLQAALSIAQELFKNTTIESNQ